MKIKRTFVIHLEHCCPNFRQLQHRSLLPIWKSPKQNLSKDFFVVVLKFVVQNGPNHRHKMPKNCAKSRHSSQIIAPNCYWCICAYSQLTWPLDSSSSSSDDDILFKVTMRAPPTLYLFLDLLFLSAFFASSLLDVNTGVACSNGCDVVPSVVDSALKSFSASPS